ncbi:MAG: glycosyltransferase family 39 protein [Candidatus Promineifilaceae bacterium]|nr:glycosyltransferase family 39 protein [Candidatus Promineifilaceae bacterium]
MLLLALFTAVILRFFQLGELPPGLYRDEAFNGLDALKVLEGDHALFFQANNGREPFYIYLTAAAVLLFGRTALAVRLAAAVIGSLTTVPVYLLGKSWFGAGAGILAAWLWAITFWPVHLSRIGLRVILLVPLLTLTFWLGTLAYRRNKRWIWFAAGLVYGLGIYTYLAARLTPILLLFAALYLLITGRGRRLWPGTAWFLVGTLLSILPFLFLLISQPDLLLGRTGQVSILHPDVNGGDFWGTLLRQTGSALGMFIWRGDLILRHNLVGRPVFDLLMAIPFLIGVVWCIRHWRCPAAAIAIIWSLIMLAPTILADDAPHFLRAAGVLPAVLMFPAIGLDQIRRWPRLSRNAGMILVSGLMLGSLLWNIRDFNSYRLDPQLGNAYELAAARLAQEINDEGSNTTIFLDKRLWSSWPSISFLVTEPDRLSPYRSPDDLPQPVGGPVSVYAWPYETLDFVPEVFASAALVSIESGDQVPGVEDNPPYTLFVRYKTEEADERYSLDVNFGDHLQLYQAGVIPIEEDRLQVDLYWQAEETVGSDLVVFIHVLGAEGLIAQADAPLAQGRWSSQWWRPDLLIHERHILILDEPYDPMGHKIKLGVYGAQDGQRLPVRPSSADESVGTTWPIDGGKR